MKKKIKLALSLSLLSPFFGEMVSGSSPPLEFFHPAGFLFLWGLYGGGVLIIREIWTQWGKGYERLMILGIFYGIFEEGLAVKSFFDPGWHDLDILGTYGRTLGVNFVWGVWLSIFHAVFSITVPILIIHVLYPRYRDKRLLSERGFLSVLSVFLFTGLFIFLFITDYRPPMIHYLITVFISIYLIYIAKKIDSASIPRMRSLVDKAFFFGLFFTTSLFILYFVVPNILIDHGYTWPLPCIVGIYLLIRFYQRIGDLDRKGVMACILGVLSPFLLFFDPVLELNGIRGMSLVGIITFIVLFWIYRRLD